MAKKTKATGKMSSGNKSKVNIAKEERRQAEFAKRREEGKTYKYKPIPFPKGTCDYYDEKLRRAEKNITHKTPVAKMRSIMAKLDKELSKRNADFKAVKERKNNKKAVEKKENK